MSIFYVFAILILGLVVGSFLTAYTYRWPRAISVTKGRSFCDKCNAKIHWFDNIPLLSYIRLSGKCRNCGKKISARYPLIELSTGVLFVTAFSLLGKLEGLGVLLTAYYLLLTTILIAILIIDLENFLIPDELVFLIFALSFVFLLFSSNNQFYKIMLSSFGAASFILSLNLVTRGRGMGLGDVKLALAGGLFFGWPNTVTWLFASFIIGAIIGILLIALGRAKFGKHIPFGPFLVISWFVVMFWGEVLQSIFLPYI